MKYLCTQARQIKTIQFYKGEQKKLADRQISVKFGDQGFQEGAQIAVFDLRQHNPIKTHTLHKEVHSMHSVLNGSMLIEVCELRDPALVSLRRLIMYFLSVKKKSMPW